MMNSNYIGRPPRIPPDGTEGYASIFLHMVEPHPMIKTIGYFVKDDAIMQSYLQDSLSYYVKQSPKADLNFVYFYLSEPDLNKTLLSTGIEVYRFTKENSPKNCIIKNENMPAISPICKNKSHIFLPASDDKLKKSEFLKTYSKSVTSTESLSEGNYKGVEFIQKHINKKIQEIPRSVEFTVSNNNSKLYIKKAGVFEKLTVRGPLLYEEVKGNWALVGWYEKDSQQKRITVHHLRVQGPLYIWKDKQSCLSASDQPDGLAGNGNDHDQSGSSSNRIDHSASNGRENESSSCYMSNNYQDPTQRNQPGETSYQSLSHTTQRSTAPSSSQSGSAGLPPSQSGSAGLPTSQSGSTTTPTDESGLPGPPPSQSGPAVCNHLIQDILCKSESVVDTLTSMLDIDYKLLQNHRHLADYLNAPPDIKQKCNCPTIHSCTLDMLRLPHIQDVTVNTLREKVKAVGRNDVLNLIDKRIPSESRSKTIKEALNEEVMNEIAIKLDQRSSRTRKNWKDVGKQLEIDSDDLDQIGRGESNPAKELLEHAYSSIDTTLTTSGKFREIIMGFENRKDLHNLIEKMGITQDSDLNVPLEEVIPRDSSNMKKMAAYLNRSPPGLSNWKQLASAWGLLSDKFETQRSQSPTKSLLDWMCTEDHVITVDQFLDILGVKMKRYDVKEALKKEIQKVPRR